MARLAAPAAAAIGPLVDTFVAAHFERSVAALFNLMRIPSVSARPDQHGECLRAADFVGAELRRLGCKDVQSHRPLPHSKPIITGTLPGRTSSAPTALVYGHYDVQPESPLELWTSAPFEPTIRNGAIYGRGACDDKGQLWGLLTAVDAAQTAVGGAGNLPMSLRFVIEGEEEVGSPSLAPFLAAEAARSGPRPQIAVICDTSMLSLSVPSITTGLRGLTYLEVSVVGPNRDLHSGVYGGAICNPLHALSAMIASLHDKTGRVAVEGFYDGVTVQPASERAAAAAAAAAGGMDDKALAASVGAPSVIGEPGFSGAERASVRPTVEVNGLWGGYIGEGAKTVLPSRADAKISARLVPGQDPTRIAALLQKHLRAAAEGRGLASVDFKQHPGSRAVVVSTDSHWYRAASAAYASVLGAAPLAVRSGGSIPVVAALQDVFGIQSLLLGFGLDSDNIHSPDEHFRLDHLRAQIRTLGRFFAAGV